MARRQKIKQQIGAFLRAIKIDKIDWQKLIAIARLVISRIKTGLNWVIATGRLVISGIKTGLNWVIKALKSLSSYLWTKRLLTFVLGLLLIFGGLTLVAFVPSTHIFEGNLTVEEMSFTYAGKEPKLFLDTVRGIKSLEIEGKQTLTFTGKIQSQSTPALNQLTILEIEPIDSTSKWSIATADLKQSSELEFTELRLQPDTQVNKLSYDTYRNQLAFSLKSNTTLEKPTNTNILQLSLGNQPLKISLEGYQLKNVKLPIDSEKQRQLEFILTPNNQEFRLNLADPVTIYLQPPAPKNNESKQWFRGKIEVKDVQFQRLDRTGANQDDNLPISTILEGKVKMAEQEREIKPNQFLMVEEPGIKLIRYLNIVPQKGLEVRISGKSKLIQIGLDQEFPVSRIQASWLDGVLSGDAIIALISFCAASFSYLLYFIIDDISKSTSRNP
ncbi:hypothetical protein QUB68_26245 [Microcoleus sp. A006_D1]|uniref:hypothetical protein n=1 Tax=Microcoleus sp. A006_D1 TaxID=3055267 RepID=UPI002FD2D2D6